MKSLPLSVFIASTALLATVAHSQSNLNSCAKKLMGLVEAESKFVLGAEIKAYEEAGCVKKPSSVQLEKASIDGLLYLLYTQSTKRLTAMSTIRNGAASGSGSSVVVGSSTTPDSWVGVKPEATPWPKPTNGSGSAASKKAGP